MHETNLGLNMNAQSKSEYTWEIQEHSIKTGVMIT